MNHTRAPRPTHASAVRGEASLVVCLRNSKVFGGSIGVPRRAAPALRMTSAEHDELVSMSRSATRPHRVVVQARAMLWAAQGVANEEIARRCEVDPDAVRRWRAGVAAGGPGGGGGVGKGRGPQGFP